MSEDFNNEEYLHRMQEWWRAANYLSASQLYLLDNPLLKRPLEIKDVKKKIVGHWGTVPGQNFVTVHLNRVINILVGWAVYNGRINVNRVIDAFAEERKMQKA